MIRAQCAFAIAVLLPWAASAEDISDPVPGHPGVTYAALLKQVAPDLKKADDGTWTLSGIPHFRRMSPTKDPFATEIQFKDLQILHLKEDGRSRLLLFTNDAGGDMGFDALLAAYDDSANVPKLLDAMDVGGDRFNDIGMALRLSARTDAVIVSSSHDNSNQSYELDTPIFLHGGKLHAVATIFTLGNGFCSYKTTQSPVFAVRPEPGAKYGSIVVSVTVETTPGESDCGEDQKPPKYSKTVVTDRYRWNDKKAAFLAVTGAVERLSAANFKSL